MTVWIVVYEESYEESTILGVHATRSAAATAAEAYIASLDDAAKWSELQFVAGIERYRRGYDYISLNEWTVQE